MDVVHVARKGKLLNILEKYYIRESAYPGLHIDGTYEII
jgi:hypothetical protein